MTQERAVFPAFCTVLTGVLTIAALAGGLGAWVVTADISAAVIAPGQIEVAGGRQIVQHPDGGVVAAIAVSEGAAVRKGDLLVRLDDSMLNGELAIIENQLFETIARRARLTAERDDDATIRFPEDLKTAIRARPGLTEMAADQMRLLALRRDALRATDARLGKQLEQIASQIAGIDAEIAALRTQSVLIGEELDMQSDLLERGLAEASQVLALRREAARIAGQIGALTASRAQSEERRAELGIERDGLIPGRREEAIVALRDMSVGETDLAERRRVVVERIRRLDIRAPASGIVLGLRVTTRQSVIRAAEPILELVPQDRALTVVARVPATDVDQVHPGQAVRLRFPALAARTTPDLSGTVRVVSADAIRSEGTPAVHYRVEIAIGAGEIGRLGGLQLRPGMPVEAFIRTEDRAPIAYLVKPLADYFHRAFRES